jgi:transposase-like protein
VIVTGALIWALSQGVKVGRDQQGDDDVRAWAQRPLEEIYPVVFLDTPGAEDPRGRQRAAPRLLPRARRQRQRRRRPRRARDVVLRRPRVEVRRVIYTTNAIEALNRQLRKAIKTKGQFPTRTPPAS